MKSFSLSLMSVVLASLLCSGAAMSAESVDKSLEVKADGLVEVENVRGKIQVLAWDKAEVSVKGVLDSETEQFIFETEGSTTKIRIKTPNNLMRGEGSDLVIRVPKASRVHASLVSADLTIKGVRGGTEGNTVSGDIKAEALGERIELNAVSGDLVLRDSEGRTELGTVSGEIDAEVDSESVSISTVSGNAKLSSGKGVAELKLNTVSGNIDVRAELAPKARVEGSSVSGDLRLFVNKDVDAVIELNTAAGGDVVNGLSDHRPARGMIGNEELEFRMGEGSGNIDLSSVSGTLEIQPR
ncbi:MAG: DUF4097 family beta strand repeat protein [Gammaproteobacteria bacterium]|nr:DUF4097 family beta strand repeat protein [Gammaproteobacteria bacterium]